MKTSLYSWLVAFGLLCTIAPSSPAQITGQKPATQEPEALRTALSVAARDQDWPRVVAVGSALAAADSTAVDLPYSALMFTAYTILDRTDQAAAISSQVATRFPTAGPWRWYAHQLQSRDWATPNALASLQQCLQRQPEDSVLAYALLAVATAAGDLQQMIMVLKTPAVHPLLTMLMKDPQEWPPQNDPFLTQIALAVAIKSDAWPRVLTLIPMLEKIDSAGVDTLVLSAQLAAYDRLQQPDALWGDGSCAGGVVCYGLTDSARSRLPEQALAVAERVTARFPHTRTLWRQYAIALRNAARPPQPDLAVLVRGVLQHHADDPQFARNLLAGFADEGDWVGAIVIGEAVGSGQAIADTASLRQLFTAYRNTGQLRQAALLADTLLRQHGHDASILSALTVACGDLEDWPRVVRIGEVVAHVDSTISGKHEYGLLMATAYSRLHRPRDAAAILAAMTTRFSQDAAVWLRYAEVLGKIGQPRKESAAIARAFQLDRDQSHVTDASVWRWYADKLRRAGQSSLASEAGQRAAALLPQ